MIDINFLRANPDAVRENIRKKFQDKKLPLVDEVLELDAKRRELQKESYHKQDNGSKHRVPGPDSGGFQLIYSACRRVVSG